MVYNVKIGLEIRCDVFLVKGENSCKYNVGREAPLSSNKPITFWLMINTVRNTKRMTKIFCHMSTIFARTACKTRERPRTHNLRFTPFSWRPTLCFSICNFRNTLLRQIYFSQPYYAVKIRCLNEMKLHRRYTRSSCWRQLKNENCH